MKSTQQVRLATEFLFLLCNCSWHQSSFRFIFLLKPHLMMWLSIRSHACSVTTDAVSSRRQIWSGGSLAKRAFRCQNHSSASFLNSVRFWNEPPASLYLITLNHQNSTEKPNLLQLMSKGYVCCFISLIYERKKTTDELQGISKFICFIYHAQLSLCHNFMFF